MLEYNRIDISKEINVDRTNKSKERNIYHVKMIRDDDDYDDDDYDYDYDYDDDDDDYDYDYDCDYDDYSISSIEVINLQKKIFFDSVKK